jgi:hypothetical protein
MCAKSVQDIARGGAVVAQNTIVGDTPGNRRVVRKVVTGDANYPAGGYPITPGDLGFALQIDYLEIINDSAGPTGAPANVSWFWNRATQKMQLMVVSTGVENATADMHLASCDIRAEGL